MDKLISNSDLAKQLMQDCDKSEIDAKKEEIKNIFYQVLIDKDCINIMNDIINNSRITLMWGGLKLSQDTPNTLLDDCKCLNVLGFIISYFQINNEKIKKAFRQIMIRFIQHTAYNRVFRDILQIPSNQNMFDNDRYALFLIDFEPRPGESGRTIRNEYIIKYFNDNKNMIGLDAYLYDYFDIKIDSTTRVRPDYNYSRLCGDDLFCVVKSLGLLLDFPEYCWNMHNKCQDCGNEINISI